MNVAIVGITGSVGKEMLRCINDLNISIKNLYLFASKKSAGTKMIFKDHEYVINEILDDSFKNINVALFAISSELSIKYFKLAKKYNCIVIDNSSAFRLDLNHPLIIPEINSDLIFNNNGLIANPNCSTILMNLTLWKIYKKFGIKRIIVSTYQAASGAGIEGIQELKNQNKELIEKNKVISKKVFGRQYANNVFCHNSNVNILNGYNEEELKMINETKKIFNNQEIKISVTCVRVPVLRAHSESINITLNNKASEEEIRELLSKSDGIKVLDDRIKNCFPEPINTANKHDVYVGRIRKDIGQEDGYGYEMFISGDQILKGAALNAVQILENVQRNIFKIKR